MPMQAPQEQLGSFYLGAEYDLNGGARKDDSPIHYDARDLVTHCLLYTSPSPRDRTRSRMPSSA